MKKLFLLCSIALSLHAVAQQTAVVDTPTKVNHQLGLSITQLFRGILNINGDDNLPISPYVVTYELGWKNKAIRLGMGGHYTRDRQQDELATVNRITYENQTDVRLGFAWREQVGKHWDIEYGLDAVGHQFSQQVATQDAATGEIVTTTTVNASVGGGPIAGIYLLLNRHIGFYVETGFYFTSGIEKVTAEFSDEPQFNTVDRSFLNMGQFIMPTTLYLVVRK